MEAMIGIIAGVVLYVVVSGVIIWTVSKFNLGLHVESFAWAMAAGALIGVATNVIMNVIPANNDILHLVTNLVVSALVIYACGALLKGMTVKGYGGALLAAVGIAVVSYLLVLIVLGGAFIIGQTTASKARGGSVSANLIVL